jgi:hypothetical protein
MSRYPGYNYYTISRVLLSIFVSLDGSLRSIGLCESVCVVYGCHRLSIISRAPSCYTSGYHNVPVNLIVLVFVVACVAGQENYRIL